MMSTSKSKDERSFSLEYFPPKTSVGKEKLKEVQKKLSVIDPAFCSCTYGAGGSTRDNTMEVVLDLHKQNIPVAPHLSFGGDSEDTVEELLNLYKDAGINQIVALRGDLPSGMGNVRLVYANELVEFIRKTTGDHFHIHVAAYPEIHPQAPSYDQDIAYLKGKFDAGANSAITQYFYTPEAYYHFIDQCQKIGIDQPIYPGIMPITNFANLVRFSGNCGADIPRWMRQKFASYHDDIPSIKAFGLEVVTSLSEKLLESGAPGLHFYTMNQADTVLSIWESLNLGNTNAE